MEFALLPTYYIVTVVGIFGLIIGSFLDVFASRFHTGVSINGRSHCTSCGHTLSWYELIPFFSYIALRGRCLKCGGHIPTRLLLMELSCAFLFEIAYFTAPSVVLFCTTLVMLSILLVIAVYDIRHMVIPDEFVIALCTVLLFYLLYDVRSLSALYALVPHLLSACVTSFFFLVLWLISKGRWIGLGDVKLAFPLGLALTWYSAFSFVVLSFWVGAVLSLVLLAAQHVLRSGQHHLPIFGTPLTMKSEVPFAPFMIVAFILVLLGNVDVLSFMFHFI